MLRRIEVERDGVVLGVRPDVGNAREVLGPLKDLDDVVLTRHDPYASQRRRSRHPVVLAYPVEERPEIRILEVGVEQVEPSQAFFEFVDVDHRFSAVSWTSL